MNAEYSKMLFSIRVSGSPVGRGAKKLSILHWMESIRDAARLKTIGDEYPVKLPVKILCRFRTLSNARKCDLDNLVKCAIDALGAGGLFAPSRSGGHQSEWNTEDWLVSTIVAEKEAADDPETEIEVWG